MTQPPRTRRKRRFRLIAALVLLGLLAGWFGYRVLTSGPAGTPQAVELAEARISDRLASATVLAVGEATHGTHEFRAAWQTVAVQLAERGFTTLAFEESAGNVSAVNEWVQGGPGTVEDAVRRFGFRLSRTQEMVDLITWARQFTRTDPSPTASGCTGSMCSAPRPTGRLRSAGSRGSTRTPPAPTASHSPA